MVAQLHLALVMAIDARLGTPDPKRDPGPLADLGPIQRQLRALLWKHHVEGYDAMAKATMTETPLNVEGFDRPVTFATMSGVW